MPADIRANPMASGLKLPVCLGPSGPFPETGLSPVLERRWLHYAFLSRDNQFGVVANVAKLGPGTALSQSSVRNTSILLVYCRGKGWHSSQFNCRTGVPLWSAFRQPHDFADPQPFQLASISGSPSVKFTLQRSCRPCTSQCAPFAGNGTEDWHHLRWQSEPGVIARGDLTFDGLVHKNAELVGYHERVRGFWGWPELGGWVFGFANDPAKGEPGAPPPAAVVFTLVQPRRPHGAANGSIMLWRNGRMVRHFPRRNVSIAVRGQLDRDHVVQVPALANLFNVPPMQPIPRRLMVTGRMGEDRVSLDFLSEAAARVVIPNETGIDPFSVHEVIGPCHVEGMLNGQLFEYHTQGIVEFAGGAGGE